MKDAEGRLLAQLEEDESENELVKMRRAGSWHSWKKMKARMSWSKTNGLWPNFHVLAIFET